MLLLALTSSLQALVLEDLVESNELMETLKGKSLGYYTGSFDSIHVGHKSFARGVVEVGLCDYVLIVPAWGGDGPVDDLIDSEVLEVIWKYGLYTEN